MVVLAADGEVRAMIVDVAVIGVVDDAATGVVASLGNVEMLVLVIKSSRRKVVIRVDATIVDVVATATGERAFFIADTHIHTYTHTQIHKYTLSHSRIDTHKSK